MRGLDPRINDEPAQVTTVLLCLRTRLMDCRVKPGNDRVANQARQILYAAALDHSSFEAIAAPCAKASSFAHMICGWTRR